LYSWILFDVAVSADVRKEKSFSFFEAVFRSHPKIGNLLLFWRVVSIRERGVKFIGTEWTKLE
jgi:hypothetical protein